MTPWPAIVLLAGMIPTSPASVRRAADARLREDPMCSASQPPVLEPEERRWCVFADRLEETCPGMARACARLLADGATMPEPCHPTASECSGRGVSLPGIGGSAGAPRDGQGGSYLPPGDAQGVEGGEGGVGGLGEPGGGSEDGAEFDRAGLTGVDTATAPPEGDEGPDSSPDGGPDSGAAASDTQAGSAEADHGRDSAGVADGAGAIGSGREAEGESAASDAPPVADAGPEDPPQDPKQDEEDEENEEDEEDEEDDDESLSLAAWIVLGLLLGAGSFFLIRAILRARKRSTEDAPEQPAAGEVDDEDAVAKPTVEPLEIVETDVERLLRLSRESLARGAHTDAVNHAYAALIRRLAGDGLIELDTSQTNGDHVRSLGRDPMLQRDVEGIVDAVEGVQFGHLEASSASGGVLERVTRVVARRIAPLAMVVLALGGLSCRPPPAREVVVRSSGGIEGRGVEHHGPMGSSILVGLLEDAEIDTEHHLGPIAPLLQSKQPIVLMGGAVPTPEEWDQLMAWVESGGSLVVASWPGAVPPQTGAWSVISDCDPSTTVTSLEYPSLDISVPALGRVQPTKKNLRKEIATRGDNIYAARFVHAEGEVIVFADDFLFTNAAMAVGDDASFMVRFLGDLAGEDTLRLVDNWTGVGAFTPIEAIVNSHLTPFILQGLLFVALLYLARGVVFGRARDPKPRSRREFSDHVRALGAQYRAAKAHQHITYVYGGWAFERLRERIPGGGALSIPELAAAVATRTGRDPASVTDLLNRATSPGLPRPAQLQTIRELSRLLDQMGGIR